MNLWHMIPMCFAGLWTGWKGSGTEEVVVLKQYYPTFQGALIVCSGGGDAQVQLLITQAVSALTGLSAARISVCQGG